MAHAAGDSCSLFGDVRQFFCTWAFVHCRIGNKRRVRFADHDVNAKGHRILFRIKHATQFAQCLAKGAGNARNHGISLIHLQQQRAKDVAVAVDHPLNIASQIATALKPVVQSVDHFIDQRTLGAVMDFIVVRVRAELDQLFGDARVTANQYRNAVAILFELDGSSQDDIFFSLSENHALGFRARGLIHLRQRRCGRVLACTQAGAIGVHIGNRLLRHARIHRSLGNCGGNNFHQTRIKW